MPPQPYPQPRIDTIVLDAATREERRRTDYSGSVWFGRPPEIGALRLVAPGSRYLSWESGAFFLPDSDYHFVVGTQASWVDDPRGGDLGRLQLALTVHAGEPLGITYRVEALCAPGAVAEAP